MAGPLLASVSVDLDPLACYYRIHALGPMPAAGGLADVVIRRSVPRFLEIFARHGVRATFFVVGADLAGGTRPAQAARALVREIAAAGHEVANHSFSHPYDLARLPEADVREEIRRADGEIAAAAGTRLEGFRAPGYDVSAVMLDEITRLGYAYDSSIFPAPGYYAAKAAVMAALRLAGRPSGAVLTNPWALLAPGDPYRPDAGAPWRRGQASVVELPVAVTPGLRVPAIGTNLLLAPTRLRASWLDRMQRRPFFNFELHGIDLMDADRDGIPSGLVARQPDLRASLTAKRRALEATLDRLALDYRFVTLREVARQVQRQGGVKLPGLGPRRRLGPP
jgi:peptidoglycan-N-acetylglucosamine deacetylase